MVHSTRIELPVDFRHADTHQLINDRILPGESCSLVGIGSVGKSNFLRFLTRPDVLGEHLKNTDPPDLGQHIFPILIDQNLALPIVNSPSEAPTTALLCWQGYEHILHGLFRAVDGIRYQRPKEFEDNKRLQALREELATLEIAMHDGSNPLFAHLGIRRLEHALGVFFWVMPRTTRVVIMFDEFEEMLFRMPVEFFQSLRGLRDEHKYQLMYLTFTRRELGDLAMELQERQRYEAFLELFATDYISFYSRDECEMMLARLAGRHPDHWQPTPSLLDAILEASAGHAGLIRALFDVRTQIPQGVDAAALTTWAVTAEPVIQQCQTIWCSLTDYERMVLKSYADAPESIDEQQLSAAALQRKKLMTREADQWVMTIPVLNEFLLTANLDDIGCI